MLFASTSLWGIARRSAACALAFAGALFALERRAFALTDQPNLPVPNVGDGAVRAILRSGNTVYIAGSFTTINGVARNRLAAFNASTGELLSWSPSANGEVRALAMSGSKIFVGGQFSLVNGSSSRSCAAAFDASTGATLAWNPNIGGPLKVVTDMEILGSTIYVVGDFTTVNGSLGRVDGAAFDLNNGAANGWNPNVSGGANPHIHGLAVSASAAYIGGEFTSVGGAGRTAIAAVNLTNGGALAWNAEIVGNGTTVETLLLSGSTLYAGGRFTGFDNGSEGRLNLAALNASTAETIDWRPSPLGDVLAVAVLGGSVFAGGDFVSVNGNVPKLRLAEFGAASGTATAWNPSINNRVFAIHAASDKVFVGGLFTNASGLAVARLAGYNPASVSTPTVTPTASPSPTAAGTGSVSPSRTPSIVPTTSPSPFPTESLTPAASPSLSPTPAPTNLAAMAGHTLPETLAASSRIHVGVTMLNSGGTLWTAIAGHRLAILADDCGLTSPPLAAIELPPDAIIPPGVPHQFAITLHAPTTSGPCSLQVRMEQNPWEQFGVSANLQIEIVPEPNAARDWSVYE